MDPKLMLLCLLFFLLLISVLVSISHRNIKHMIDSDKAYKKEKKSKDGEIVNEQGRTRSRWDYSVLPGFTRMLMKVDPKLILASLLLLILITLWIFIRESTILDLVKINFGALLGALISKNDSDRDEK